MKVFPTPMIAQLAQAMRQRFYTAKLEGLHDQAAFEEIIRTILETYEEAQNTGDGVVEIRGRSWKRLRKKLAKQEQP